MGALAVVFNGPDIVRHFLVAVVAAGLLDRGGPDVEGIAGGLGIQAGRFGLEHLHPAFLVIFKLFPETVGAAHPDHPFGESRQLQKLGNGRCVLHVDQGVQAVVAE